MLELKYYSVHKIENLKDLFSNLSHRTRFNRARRNLESVINVIRNEIGNYLGYNQSDFYIVDSMPISVCGFGRAHFSKRFKDIATYGYCASKKFFQVTLSDSPLPPISTKRYKINKRFYQ